MAVNLQVNLTKGASQNSPNKRNMENTARERIGRPVFPYIFYLPNGLMKYFYFPLTDIEMAQGG